MSQQQIECARLYPNILANIINIIAGAINDQRVFAHTDFMESDREYE